MTIVTMKMTYNGGAAAYSTAVRQKLSGIVRKAAQDVAATAINEIQNGEHTGAIYMKGKNKDRPHTASAPDESPATDTGNLINSINVDNGLLVNNTLSSTVNVGAEYGLYLEMGTVHIAPRPFLAPALVAVEPAFIAECEAALNG